MLERVILAMEAAELVPMVMAGSITCFQLEKPVAGSHFSFTANTSISSNPCQKFGIALPTMAMPIDTLSNIEYCHTAASRPIVMPITTARATEIDVSFRVLGKVEAILSETFRFVE